jgi:hypothetical protein
MFLQLRSKEGRPDGGPTSVTVAEKKAIFSSISCGSQSSAMDSVDINDVSHSRPLWVKAFCVSAFCLRLEKRRSRRYEKATMGGRAQISHALVNAVQHPYVT